MSSDHFEAPVFEIQKSEKAVDITKTPFFYNDGGSPTYVANLPSGVTPLVPAATDPAVAMGGECLVPEVIGIKKTDWGTETQLGFLAKEVAFEPMWATRAVAAAFGITLVNKGEAVKLTCPVPNLSAVEYEYGVFCGHWSPYQEKITDKPPRMITSVITDLEHHDFPHVFASTDPQLPLVISVGRYWPKLSKICLADLWIPRGSALYIPPKPYAPDADCIDLHNNRNSARACWGHLEKETVITSTLLQTENPRFYWFWNARDTAHRNLHEER